jgi:hypothetical protein
MNEQELNEFYIKNIDNNEFKTMTLENFKDLGDAVARIIKKFNLNKDDSNVLFETAMTQALALMVFAHIKGTKKRVKNIVMGHFNQTIDELFEASAQ